jgi:glycosyltransferase involved in cell wall biosynthesis
LPAASIVITTRNRRDDLRKALGTAVAQRGDVEVLVVDDGSTDGTSAMVREEFPQVQVHRDERSRGYIAQRNRAAELASSPIIVSVDDDALFESRDTVAQTLREFDHPRIGAVAIPFVNVNEGPMVRQLAPTTDRIWATSSFRGTAHALRREPFIGLGGYRTMLLHQAEEQDYALRMLGAGLVTRLGSADPIMHFESPDRDWHRLHVHAARNDLLHGWHNVPLPYAPVRFAKVTLYWLWVGMRRRRLGAVVRGLARGYVDGARNLGDRRPVSRNVYRLDHDIRKRGPLPLEHLLDRLPPLDRWEVGESAHMLNAPPIQRRAR